MLFGSLRQFVVVYVADDFSADNIRKNKGKTNYKKSIGKIEKREENFMNKGWKNMQDKETWTEAQV